MLPENGVFGEIGVFERGLVLMGEAEGLLGEERDFRETEVLGRRRSQRDGAGRRALGAIAAKEGRPLAGGRRRVCCKRAALLEGLGFLKEGWS